MKDNFSLKDATHFMRDICGVYLLYMDETVVYVGKSTHVPSRVRTHASQGKVRFNKVLVAYCTKEEMDGLECRLIGHFWPKFHNPTGPNIFPKMKTGHRISLEALGLIPKYNKT